MLWGLRLRHCAPSDVEMAADHREEIRIAVGDHESKERKIQRLFALEYNIPET